MRLDGHLRDNCGTFDAIIDSFVSRPIGEGDLKG
jgi:hypothetical protein